MDRPATCFRPLPGLLKRTISLSSSRQANTIHICRMTGTLYSRPFAGCQRLFIQRACLFDLLSVLSLDPCQWFFFSRNIGYLTPKTIYFHYLQKKSGSKYPKNIIFNFEKEDPMIRACTILEVKVEALDSLSRSSITSVKPCLSMLVRLPSVRTYEYENAHKLHAICHSIAQGNIARAISASAPPCVPELPFSNFNVTFFGYVHPGNIFLDNEKNKFSG